VVARGISFLEKVAEGEPFFLFLHTYEIHNDYNPPAPYEELFVAPEVQGVQPLDWKQIYAV
jgi:hypothetical protein